jgi:hypothetical protein
MEEVKRVIRVFVGEYLSSADVEGVQQCVVDMDASHFHPEVVKIAVRMGLDRADMEMEFVSQLLNGLVASGTITRNQCEEGFLRILHNLGDIVIDTPQAPQNVATFIFRAEADGCLSPGYLQACVPPGILAAPGMDALAEAMVTLQARTDVNPLRVWGSGISRPVSELKSSVRLLIDEFLQSSGDVTEALRCLAELSAPFFHHEFVKRAVIVGTEGSTDQRKVVILLLQQAAKREAVTPGQFVLGFQRALTSLPDLVLDAPAAGASMNEIVLRSVESNIITQQLVDKLPAEVRDLLA